MPDFKYQEPMPLGADKTKYYKIEGSEKFVSVESFGEKTFSKSTLRL